MYKILITQGIQSIVSTLARVFGRLAIFITQQLLRFLRLVNIMTLKRIAVLLFIFSQVMWAPLLYAAEVGHAPNTSQIMVTDAKTSVPLDKVLSSGQAGSVSGTTGTGSSGTLTTPGTGAKVSYTVGPTTASTQVAQTTSASSADKKPSVVNLGTKSDVDESSGAFLYSLPIKVPAGRGGLSPSINLSYDSRRNNQTSYIGLGWDIEMPSVQRMNKNGIDVMYDETNFTATGYGELSRTTNTAAQFGQYSAKYGFGEFMYRDNNTWEITDKNGVTSIYGATARDRIDTGDVDRTQSWVLSKQADQLGNTIDYTYIKSEGKLYPQSIIYNDGAARIDFTYNVLNTKTAVPQYNSYGQQIADDIGEVVDYGSGVRAKADRILSNISVTAMGDRRLDYGLQGGDYLRSVSGEFGNIQFQYREQMQAPTIANENLAVINNPSNYVERYGFYANPRTTNGALMYRWYPTSGFNSGATWTDIDRDGKKEMIGVYTDWLIDSQRPVSDYYFWYNPVNYQNKRVIEIYQVDKTATYGFSEKTNLRLTNLTASNFEFDSSITTSAQTVSNFYISNAWMSGENLMVTVTNTSNSSQSFSGYLTFDTTKNKYVLKASTTAVTPPPAAPSPYPTIPAALQTEIQKYNQPYISWYDVDYDDKLDLIVQHKDGMRVYHNDGTTGGVTSFSYAPQYDLTGIKIADTATPTFILWRDINGDGLDDLYRAGKWFLNRRTMMQYSEGYTLAGQAKEFIISGANQLMDINGDSLLDIPAAQRINTGTSFEVVSNKALNAMGTKTALYNVQATGSTMPADVRTALIQLGCNPDYVQSSTYCSDRASLMNLVGGWGLPWNNMYLAFEGDMNGDGITDKVYTTYWTTVYYVVYMKEGSTAPLSALDRDYVGKLTTINNATPSGPTQTNITYKKEKLDNERVDGSPATVWAVDTIDYGSVQEYTPTYKSTPVKYTYTYSGGRIYKDPTELSKRTPGFAKVTETDPLGFSTTSYFHQGNGDDTTSYETGDNVPGKIGRVYRTEVKNSAGELMQVGINKYSSVDLGNSKQYVYLEQSQSYDKQKQLGTATGYTVDTTIGEVTRTHDYGAVTPSSWDTLNGTWSDTGTDGLISETEYTALLPLVRPTKSIVRDLSNQSVLRESSYVYDGGTLSKGLLTKASTRIDGGTVRDTLYTYSPRGTLTSTTDALGNTTSYTLDKQELYPTTVTNPLGQITQVVMDYLLGKPKKVTTPDGVVSEYEYHPVYDLETKYTRGGVLARDANISGRSINSTEYYTSIYTPPSGAPSVKTGNGNLANNITINPQGLIENTYSSAGGQYMYRYNARGQETQITPPGASSSYAINKTYDTYGRLNSSVSPLGTTTYNYSGLSVTETRPNGGITTNTYDARGRLISVADNNGTSNYVYDGVGNLIGITDADGNKRDFTYDMLGQRKQMTDYYRSGDNTYGVYSFTYDMLGRITSELRPDGSTVATTYDKLSRPLTITAGGDTITYTYDTCKTSKLCSVTRGTGYSNSYTYNDAGFVSAETKTIRGQSRTFNYGYNVNGSVAREISPLGTLEYYYTGNGYGGSKPTYTYWNGNDNTRKNSSQYSMPIAEIYYAYNNTSPSYLFNYFAQYNPNTSKRISMNSYWNYDWSKLGLPSSNYLSVSSPVTSGQIVNESYTYNGNADITKIINTGTLTGKTTDYTYDGAGRLTRYQVTSPTKGSPVDVSYTYSPAGNIMSITPAGASGLTTNMTYNQSGTGSYLPGTSAPATNSSSTTSSGTSSGTSGTGSSTTTGGSSSGSTSSGTTGTTSGTGTTSCTSPQVWSTTANACVSPTAFNWVKKAGKFLAQLKPVLINTAYAEESGTGTTSGTSSGTTGSTGGSTSGSTGSSSTTGSSTTCTSPLVWDATTSTCVSSTTSGSGTAGTGTSGTGSTGSGSGTTSGTGSSTSGTSGTSTSGTGTNSGTGTGSTTTTSSTTSTTVNDLITSLLQKIQSGFFTIQQDGRLYTVVDTAGATTAAVTTTSKTSGVITINRGQTTATVTFKTPFASTPEIIVTPSNSHAGTTVTIISKSATGFTISIPNKDYTSKRTFTYLAFASDKDDAESAPDDLPADIADIYRDINKLDQVVVDEANMVNVYTNPHAILRYGNTYMVYNKLGQVIMVKQYSNPTCTGGTATTPPTCTTPTLLNTQTRSYTGDNRLKNIDTSTYTVNTEYDDKGNKVWEETVDKASGNRKVVTYWTDTERTYQNCSGTTCTTDREERDILVDGRRHATMIVKNGVETYRYYVTSNLGTTNLVLGEDGAILEESDTNPYGDIRYGSNDPNTTTYYGLHERNDTTGLVDMEARMYDPSNLQFSAPDPMSLYSPMSFLSDPQQLNTYSYARGNPVRYNDPTGMASKSVKSVVSSAGKAASAVASKVATAIAGSSAFKSVSGKLFGGGSSTPTASKPMQSPTYTISSGAWQGPVLPTSTWDPITDKRIDTLDPRLKQPALNFINAAESNTGIQLRVVQAKRTFEEQDKLYAQGRTTPGKVVTQAKGGDSYHNYGLALDVVVMENGNANFDKVVPSEVVAIAKNQGFEWGGDWATFKDYPHFQMVFGQKIKDLKNN